MIKNMKILKARNGIALTAVLAILLITSLFIPVMFSMGETSLSIAVKAIDRQRSNYFARSITEMTVAAFKAFDSDEYTKLSAEKRAEYTSYTSAQKAEKDKVIAEYEKLLNGNKSQLVTQEIAMLVKDGGTAQTFKKIEIVTDDKGNQTRLPAKTITYREYRDLELAYIELTDAGVTPDYELIPEPGTYVDEKYIPNDIIYVNKSTTEGSEYHTYTTTGGYKELGVGKCIVTFDNEIKYYKTTTSSQETEEIKATAEETAEEIYNRLNKALDTSLWQGQVPPYSLSVVKNRNLKFTSTATVNGYTTSKICVLVLPIYPSDEEWFELGVGSIEYEKDENGKYIFDDNGNRIPTEEFSQKNDDGSLKVDEDGNRIAKIKEIPSGGNQVFVDPSRATSRIPIEYDQAIDSDYLKQTLLVYSSVGNMLIKPTKFKDLNGNKQSSGVNNSQFVLGVQPGLNTTPNNDPTYEIIDGVNYESSKEIAEMNNFVAFTSNSGIQVDLPINLLVNPCRANRLGDGINKKNGSLYKIMVFQAPVIQFNGRLDMMMSFYQSNPSDARRMSSVVLAAPTSTPYSYENRDRENKVVKAGMVYFTEDCYLWIIPYGENGSASMWAGVFAETVYKRDSDFTRVKIANAGDVYMFNSEIKNTDGKNIGFSLTGYYLETEYIPNLDEHEETKWYEVWSSAKNAFFKAGMNNYFAENDIYVEDDFRYVGNVFDGNQNIQPPELDDYYSYWLN